MVCYSVTRSVVSTCVLALSLLSSTNYPFASAFSENEIEKFMDNLRLTATDLDIDNDFIDNFHSSLSQIAIWCPSVKLKNLMDDLVTIGTCADVVDPFVFYQPYDGSLKSTQELCESKAVISKSVSGVVYCVVRPIIKTLHSCLASVLTPDDIEDFNSIITSLTKKVTNEVLDTAFRVLCKREDTIERLTDLISELGFMDTISMMACRKEIMEAKLRKRDYPRFFHTAIECMVNHMNILEVPGKNGLCGVFSNINWEGYKTCLGDDYLICDSETVTKIVAYVVDHDEIYVLLDKFLCNLEDSNNSFSSLSRMFDNLFSKSTDYKVDGEAHYSEFPSRVEL